MRCQATRSICVNWEYREKRDGALLIIESGNGSTGWLGAEALRSVYLGASSRSPALSPPAIQSFLLSFFLPPPSVLVRPHPPTGWSKRPFWVSDTWDLAAVLKPGPALLFSYADGRVWTPKKQQLKERPEHFWRHECPRTRGFCGLAEIRGPSLWGVSRLACGEVKLKSSRAAGRVKREGFAEKPRLAKAGFDTSYL